eukprot:5634844-Pleurochrysis_carterae.AAC.1
MCYYGIPELEERSASAPQVRMRHECKMGSCACRPKEAAARCAGFEQSTIDNGKKVSNRARGQKGKYSGLIAISTDIAIAPIALGIITPNDEGSKVQMGYGSH